MSASPVPPFVFDDYAAAGIDVAAIRAIGDGPTSDYRYLQGATPDESQLHDTRVEPICRKYLELRYRMLPYLYSAARESTPNWSRWNPSFCRLDRPPRPICTWPERSAAGRNGRP